MLDAGQSLPPPSTVIGAVAVVGLLLAHPLLPVMVVNADPFCTTIELSMKPLLKKSCRATAGPRKVSPKDHKSSPLPRPTTWVPSAPDQLPQSAVVVGGGCGLPVESRSLRACQVPVSASVARPFAARTVPSA